MPIWHILNVQSRFPMYLKKLKIQPKIVKKWSKTVPIFDFLPLFWVRFGCFKGLESGLNVIVQKQTTRQIDCLVKT